MTRNSAGATREGKKAQGDSIQCTRKEDDNQSDIIVLASRRGR